MTDTPTAPGHNIADRALTTLRRFFGYSSFRPGQLEIITTVMTGRDALVIMPTGGGKSITFQIPALMLPGMTIVVSPLLSLMRDQVEALRANGIPAATINSLQTEAENRVVIDAMSAGFIKLLYISPERLVADFPKWRLTTPVSLIAIDEAHCISRWGHDFRPEYARLAEVRHLRPDIPMMALTATADRLTRDDISARLDLRSPAIFISSFDRPNLSLSVKPYPGAKTKIAEIASFIDRYPADTGIVYCLARKTTEAIAAELGRRGYRAAAYHAALPPGSRHEVQTRFRKGQLQVVVATVAFGMGIDKSNVRWVIHNNMPSCIESYYQEIGRAGRDGLPAETLMYHSVSDIIALRHFAQDSGQAALNLEKLKRIEDYAYSGICRRRVLLSYFGQEMTRDCGNCDICLSPPPRFDATIAVKKALSAIIRTDEQVGASMLVDILRGSARADLRAHGYDRIKTYGAGRDIDAPTWQAIILQMLQLGMVEIDYAQGNRLKVTPYGRRIIHATEPVMLPIARPSARPSRSKATRAGTTPVDPRRILIDALRATRSDLAAKEGIPDYMVFSDAVIEAVAAIRPDSLDAFAAIEGISDRKAAAYWPAIAKTLAKAVSGYSTPRTTSEDITLFLFRRGHSPADIALMRGFKATTIYSHLASCISRLTTAEIDSIIDPATYAAILAIFRSAPEGKHFEPFKTAPKGAAPNPLADRYPYPVVSFAHALALVRHDLR